MFMEMPSAPRGILSLTSHAILIADGSLVDWHRSVPAMQIHIKKPIKILDAPHCSREF
jgi:hypothetical protein